MSAILDEAANRWGEENELRKELLREIESILTASTQAEDSDSRDRADAAAAWRDLLRGDTGNHEKVPGGSAALLDSAGARALGNISNDKLQYPMHIAAFQAGKVSKLQEDEIVAAASRAERKQSNVPNNTSRHSAPVNAFREVVRVMVGPRARLDTFVQDRKGRTPLEDTIDPVCKEMIQTVRAQALNEDMFHDGGLLGADASAEPAPDIPDDREEGNQAAQQPTA